MQDLSQGPDGRMLLTIRGERFSPVQAGSSLTCVMGSSDPVGVSREQGALKSIKMGRQTL